MQSCSVAGMVMCAGGGAAVQHAGGRAGAALQRAWCCTPVCGAELQCSGHGGARRRRSCSATVNPRMRRVRLLRFSLLYWPIEWFASDGSDGESFIDIMVQI
ncbi:uncharacterized protein [Triticum aestivum]|uniref:uncharacterized protein isoform X2 n=1 Tax=Triticum aestivum TaxID=4565 RepID=UPI001D0276C7|nr:uncharacterized protein LOC123141515 isoform X2 [Triticum aestivum]